ncbi:MAG: YeaC family protein [Alcanivorax sp.]|uniref:YeaC family protein n=1 Tax=Alcanivorax sp. TaxID=1872427 RepID=UPI003DA6E87C
MTYQSFDDLIAAMTPEVCDNMRRAIETGKWADGRPLTREQRETCLQAVIAWESKNLPEDQRSGYMEQQCKSGGDEPEEQPVTLRAPGRLQ